MKKHISLLLALIFILLSFASCGEEKTTIIYYPVTENFSGMDPQIVSGSASKTVDYNCFEGLVRLGDDGKIVPAGAVKWDVSSDGLTYTFYLREDAKWYLTNTSKKELGDSVASLDTRVTAKDYVFGLRRGINPETEADDANCLLSIKNAKNIAAGTMTADKLGVEAVSDYCLKITLDIADPDLLYYLTRLVAMPCNEAFFNACKGRYGLAMEYMLCNGVYMMYKWTEDTSVRLEKNAEYTGDSTAKNNTVWIYYIEDSTTVAEKVKKGTYDCAYIEASDIDEFKKKSYTTQSKSDVLWGYRFNLKSEKFSDENLRYAFASAVKHDVLTPPSYVEGKISRLLTNALTPYYDYTPNLYAYDESKAEGYFKKAIATNEKLSSDITVTVLTTDDFADAVKKQIQLWQKVFGIDVKIKTDTREKALAQMYSGDFEISFLPVVITSSNTTEYFKTYSSDSAYNTTGFANKNYDALINSVEGSMSDSQKADIYKQCEQSLLTYAAIIPEFTEASYFVQGKGVSGIKAISDEEVYFRNGTLS